MRWFGLLHFISKELATAASNEAPKSKALKLIMSNHQTSSNLPGTIRGILPKTSPTSPNSTLPPPGGRKNGSHWSIHLSEAMECRGALHRTGTVDTEAAAAADVAAEDVHSIGNDAPHRRVPIAGSGCRSARGQLTPAIGLAKVAQMFWNNYSQSLPKMKSRFWLYKNGEGHLPTIYPWFLFFPLPHLPLGVKMGWDAITTTKK